MPMRVLRSNVIGDATYICMACGQHGAREYCSSCRLLLELGEIDTWFDIEPGGCSDDFLSVNTGRLRAGDDMVDPSVGVLSTLGRTLKRARVRRPRALKRVERFVSIEERTVHFLTTVPATASLFDVHEYAEKRFKRSALSLGQISQILEPEISSGFAMSDSDKTDVGDCKNPSVCSLVINVVKDAYGKGAVCPSDRSRVKKEKDGEGDALPVSVVGAGVARGSGGDADASLIDCNCVKKEIDESNTLSFSGFVVGVHGEVDEVACAGSKVGRVVSMQCGLSRGALSLMHTSFERVSSWLTENKRKPLRGFHSMEENSIAQTWNVLCRRLQNGYSLPANIAERIREFQKQLKEDPVWIASATARSSVGKRSRIVASSSPADACTQRSKARRHSRLSPRTSPSSTAYCDRKQHSQQQPPRPRSQLPRQPSRSQQWQPEQQQLSHQLSHHHQQQPQQQQQQQQQQQSQSPHRSCGGAPSDVSGLYVSGDHKAVKIEKAATLHSTVIGESVKCSRANFGECDVRDDSNCVGLGQASGVSHITFFRRRWSRKAFREFLTVKSQEGGGRCLDVGVASGSSSVGIGGPQCNGTSSLHEGSKDVQFSEFCKDYEDCTKSSSLVTAVHDLDSSGGPAACLDSDCLREVRDRSAGICEVAACGDASREWSSPVSSLACESPEFPYMGADESHGHLMHFYEASGSEAG